MADAWFTKQGRILIERAGAAATKNITAQVTDFSMSGGTEDTSAKPVWGGGEITIEEAPEQIEVSLEFVPYDDLWGFEAVDGALVSTADTEVVTSGGSRDRHRITVTFADGFTGTPPVPNSGRALRYTFVNALAVTLDSDGSAGEDLTATLNFKVGKTDADGNPQRIVERTANAATGPLQNPYGNNGLRVAFGSYTYS